MGISPGHIAVTTVTRPSGDIALEAWNTSRPNETGATKQAIMNVDVPVNELEDFVLVMHVPILIRDIVFTLRDHVAWARTSRADDITQWEIYHGVWQHEEIASLYNDMMHRKALGQSQDRFRSMIPLSYMTTFTCKLSARSLMRFAAGVAVLANNIINKNEGVVGEMLMQFHRELTKVVRNSVYGQINPNQYGAHVIFPYTPSLKKDYAMVNGPFVQLGFKAVPFTLRAQLVRHRPIQFVDDFIDLLVDDSLLTPMECSLQMEIMMTVGMAHSLVVKRNCWIAQADIWQQVVRPLNSLLDIGSGAPVLPCSDKLHCPVAKDNQLRFEGKDPAPPCPLWCGMANLAIPDPEQTKAAMLKYAGERAPLDEWWMDQVLNFIPDVGA